ncbi:MAG: CRTAC1 family protein [Truepera sp.]|nr:CRTAC1 family protein [Truepera sp.]
MAVLNAPIVASPAGVPLRLAVLLGVAVLAASPALAQQAAPDLFVDVSEEAGIRALHEATWEEFSGENFTRGYLATGQAWGDYDNDGWVDLYLTGGLNPSALYRNDGDGTFSISEHSGDVGLPDVWTGGAVWADYDNDGFKDLYVLANGANVLFHNEAGQGFQDVTQAAGVGDTGKGTTAAWGDYDGDGYLDLYVANWSCIPECPRPADPVLASDRLYHNNRDGTFTDVSGLLNAVKRQGSAFSASFADFDNDGDPDIYVINDKAEQPIGNVLWRNDGPGCDGWCWHDASSETRSKIVKHGMGLAVGDYDNDLDLDFYFSDMVEPMALLENLGNQFRDASKTAGVGVGPGSVVGWGTAFFDFNNDGWLDLFLASTELIWAQDLQRPEGMLFPYPNPLFQNRGDGTFLDVTPTSWQQQPKPSMGVAYADYDRDGLVDFVVGNFGQGYILYRNAGLAGAENHWLTIRLEGRAPINFDAIHARVFVTTEDGLTRMQEVKSGSSLGAGNDTALHFGLGGSTSATVRVVWPDGTEDVVAEVAADRILDLSYGEVGPGE